MKILDRRRMQKRAWYSASSAAILTCFGFFQILTVLWNPRFENLFFFVCVLIATVVEWMSFSFWRVGDLRAPLWSGLNQLWLGMLGGGDLIWAAYQPAAVGMLANMPQAAMINQIAFMTNWIGGLLTFILQVFFARFFWKGGPRGYQPLLRKPAPASDWDA